MLVFIVPVKSSQLASDWALFSNLFERTLKSICNQKNQDFRVVVACHELPEITYENDKVEFLSVDFDRPKLVEDDWHKNRQLKEADKANKILFGYKKAQSYNPDYVMVVDADDCISNRITEFVSKQDKTAPGWYISRGYYYKEGTNYLLLNRKTFNNLCGSCIIIRTDLFEQLLTRDPWLYYYHELKELADGNSLKPLPFAGALYSMINGENHFMTAEHSVKLVNEPKVLKANFISTLFKRLMKYRIWLITKSFKKEFNFYNI